MEKKWESHRKALGWLFILLAVVLLFIWFYFVIPFRDAHELVVLKESINHTLFDAKMLSTQRTCWHHDDAEIIGRFGDKKCVQYIFYSLDRSSKLWGCKGAHKDRALRYITNQDIGDNVKAWLKWWQMNRQKSQKEWILDGFRQSGIQIEASPSEAGAILLLSRLVDPLSKPYLRWNICRYLRTSNYDVSGISYEKLSSLNPEIASRLFGGVKHYVAWDSAYPDRDFPDSQSVYQPRIHCDSVESTPGMPLACCRQFRIIVWGTILLSFSIGAILLRKEAPCDIHFW